MRRSDPLAITQGLVLTDAGLAYAGLSREERLELWWGTLKVFAGQDRDLGLGAWLIPGVRLWVESSRDGAVLAELGWPDMAGGVLRFPLRRFGGISWDMDGGAWAPGWWSRVLRPAGLGDWDDARDGRLVQEEIASTFDLLWMNGQWERLAWRQATPGWADRVFAHNHEAMKRGLLAAFEVAERGDPIFHLPVLAGGARLEKATLKSLKQSKTALFSPSEAGYRAFVENVRSQAVPKHAAMSMAATWWSRAFDEAVVP